MIVYKQGNSLRFLAYTEEGEGFVENQARLGVSWDLIPQRGPYPKSDNPGVHLACDMVLRSLDPGQNASHIQYEMVQNMQSFYSNYAHTFLGGTGLNFVPSEGTSTCVSNAASNCV